jgi:CheY-like chemotaxis protein
MPTKNAKILVTEDDTICRELLCALLKSAGYEVLEARDGKDAFEQIRQHRPQLLLLDMKMPSMDGFEVVRRVRQDKAMKDLLIIMLTGVADRADIIRMGELNVQGYLLKAKFNIATLLERVKDALNSPIASAA